MAIDAFRFIAFRLIVARCHSRHLSQRLEIVLGDVVVVIVGAAGVIACICTVEIIYVA